MFGSGSSPQNDGARLAREGDLVVVGVNYRLGALGWLYRPGIVDAELATSDMVAALTWVRDHIAGFGGDPSRVTLMGQSAGAMSIARLIMLPEARGLFQRVIMESAGLGRGFLTPTGAAMIADQFLSLLGIDPDSADALARLRAVEVSRLLEAQGDVTQAHVRFAESAPAFMGVLPTSLTQPELIAALADGIGQGHAFGGLDVLIGTVADEVHAHYGAHPLMQDASARGGRCRGWRRRSIGPIPSASARRNPGPAPGGPRHRGNLPLSSDAVGRCNRGTGRQRIYISLRLGTPDVSLWVVSQH